MKCAYIKNFCLMFLFTLTVLSTACPNCQAANNGSPAAALDSIGKAIDEADLDTFEDLVDVDNILKNSLSTFLNEMQKPENKAHTSPILAIMLSQAAAQDKSGEAIRALVLNEAKAFVGNGIKSGAFAGRKSDISKDSGLLAPLFANASLGRKEIRHTGGILRDNKDFLLSFTVHDYGNDHDYQVIGRFSPTENNYRLTNIENISQILYQIMRENQKTDN